MATGEVLLAFNPLLVAAGLQLAGSLLGGRKKKGDEGRSPLPKSDTDEDIERLRKKLALARKGAANVDAGV